MKSVFLQKLQEELCRMVELRQQHEHNQNVANTVDPDKLKDHIKKLRASLDLTQQRLGKFETENKSLKGTCRCRFGSCHKNSQSFGPYNAIP